MPALLLLSGPSAGLRHELHTEATIGRSPSCELPLPADDRMSRRHARFFVREGRVLLEDLGSRNGTSVNGERIHGEVELQPGDRIQVGQTTVLVAPPGPSVRVGPASEAPRHRPVQEVLPHVGVEAALYSAGVALLGATSEARVLRYAAEQALLSLQADAAAALLGSVRGLLTAAVVGAPSVEVPRDLATAALERAEQGRADGVLCSPLVASGGPPFGILFVRRAQEPFTEAEAQLAAMLGRLSGEAHAAVRSHAGAQPERVEMVGASRPFRKLVEQARRAAASDAPTVFLGEPGTGKALCAHYVHARSPRGLGPLVRVDCRDTDVLEQTLLGRSSRAGVPPLPSALLRADGGSLLLLHVEHLPHALAGRLAGLLARKRAPAREGGEEPVDVRLLATASAPLRGLVERALVHEALADRLTGLALQLPPLRERRADIPPLFERFAARGARATGGAAPGLTPEARQRLVEHDWPHNVRELELLAEWLARRHTGAELSASALPAQLRPDATVSASATLQERVARLEREAIAEALHAEGGRKSAAARRLGISRPTLDKKIEEYGLRVERRRAGA
jgi:DNA-binding NtrC family response regulator/pSer/pThr/pTyr-binding forkhead associated (FHA) protein